MKTRKTIATKIIFSVFALVAVFQIGISLLGYFSYKNNNEQSYREDNGDIATSLLFTYDTPLIEDYVDKTSAMYASNAPDKPLSEMSSDERTAYSNLYNDIGAYEDEDGANYFGLFSQVFVGNVRGSACDGLSFGFIDEGRNRFVVLFGYDDTLDADEMWYALGDYFELPSPVLNANKAGSYSYDGVKYSRNSVSFFGNGRKCENFTNDDVWLIYEQKMSVVNRSLNAFMVFFFPSMGAFTVLIFITLYFVLRRYAIAPTKKLSLEAQEYTDSLKNGEFKEVFQKSSGVPDEIDTLNDSFYYLDKEIKAYVSKVKEAATTEERMQAELSLAKKIQLSALPKGFIHDNRVSLRAYMNPAKEVGGDLYGFERLDDGSISLFVGDVSDKGVPAALFMMQAKTLLQESLSHQNLLEAIKITNKRLIEEDSEGLFLTAFIAVFNSKTGVLRYVNAGHEPIFVMHDNKYSLLSELADPPLATLDGYEYREQTITLTPRDRIFVYTDGVSESMSKDGELFGKERILETLNKNSKTDNKGIIDCMNQALDAHSLGREQYDDICMLSLSYIADEELLVKEENDLGKIPAFVEKRFGKSFDKDDISSIDVMLDELVSNVLFYSKNVDEPISVILFTNKKGEAVGLIRDHGVEFDPVNNAPKRKEGQIGGMGITITKTLATSFGYERIGPSNITYFTKKKTNQPKKAK